VDFSLDLFLLLLVVGSLLYGLKRVIGVDTTPFAFGSRSLPDDPLDHALAFVAGKRGLSHEGDVVAGQLGGRRVELRVLEPSADGHRDHELRLAVQLMHPHARALSGLTNRRGRLDWQTVADPGVRSRPEPIELHTLPRAFLQRVGPAAVDWLLETSARVLLLNGRLVADHPEGLADGDLLDEVLEAVREHASRLDDALESLPDALCEAADHERANAMALLAERFPDTPQALKAGLRWLADPVAGVRVHAASVVGELGWPALRELAEGPSGAGAVALRALLRQRSPAQEAETLRTVLRLTDPERLLLALSALAQLRHPADLDLLGARRPDEPPALRRARVQALSRFDDPRAAEHLVAYLDAVYDDVASAAALALGRSGRLDHVNDLRRRLESEPPRSELATSLKAAIWSIQDRLGGEQAQGGLSLLETDGGHLSLAEEAGAVSLVEEPVEEPTPRGKR
jgi:HEAT repeat protein